MTQPVGWYQQPDGRALYWNGVQWLAASAAAVGPSYVKRKNRTVPGTAMLVGALATAAAAFLPWVALVGNGLSVDLGMQVALRPTLSLDTSRPQIQAFLVASAMVGGVLAALMLWTKRRAWGPILRLLYAVPWSATSALCVVLWWMTMGKASDFISKDDVVGQAAGFVGDIAQAWGVLTIEPQSGLFVWSSAVVVGLIGLVVPGRLYEERIPRP